MGEVSILAYFPLLSFFVFYDSFSMNSNSSSSQIEHTTRLKRATAGVAILNLSYFGIEFAVAMAIGSVALLADSVDFLENSSLNLLILLAIGWSVRRQSVVGMILAGIMLIPSFAALWTAWTKIHSFVPPAPIPLSVVGPGALIINMICAFMLADSEHLVAVYHVQLSFQLETMRLLTSLLF